MGTGNPSHVCPVPQIEVRRGQSSDAQLLERFVADRDEEAFAGLVERYGSLVLGVCHRVLGDSHQAEDAFQATFLVLVRRASSLDGRGPLGNWLYAVAYRTATKARMTAARRRARERQAMDSMPDAYVVENQAWDELRPILDEELSQLPRKYRAPLVLCYLEGKTQQEAAQELGWPSGSMSRRMNRARQLLRVRLQKRGVATSVGMGMLFWLLPQKANASIVSPDLAASTVKAALAFKTGEGAISSGVAQLVAENEDSGAAPRRISYLLLAAILFLGAASIAYGAWTYRSMQVHRDLLGPLPEEVMSANPDGAKAAILNAPPGTAAAPTTVTPTPCHK
jgi:RNA polymerase sigma factor (sigma-70 family)